MPNTDAVNAAGDSFIQYPPMTVRLSTDSNPPADAATRTPDLFCQSVTQSAGGRLLDNAEFEWRVIAPLQNRSQPSNFARMTDVLLPDANETRVHVGDYVVEAESIGRGRPTLTAQSQIRNWHFGGTFKGQRWWEPVNDLDVTVQHGATFNPMVDGQLAANRSQNRRRDDGKDTFIWVSPAATRTTVARVFSEHAGVELWDLTKAVSAMCWACNTDETFIENPTDAELIAVIDSPQPVVLQDVRLGIGKYLPFYLDSLLQPLGYNWFIDYATGQDGDPDVRNKPKIRVFKRWVGPEKKLYHQAEGSQFNFDETNTSHYRIVRRIGDSVNDVTVYGGFEKAEVTLELYRTWLESDDSLMGSDLDKTDVASMFKDKPNVWRLWAANEGGDFVTSRETPPNPAKYNPVPDLSTVFTGYVPHRRNIEEPITWLDEDNAERQPLRIEYSTDNGTTWQPANLGNMILAPDMIAVYFDGNQPPAALMAAGASARMRITGVVTGDTRIVANAPAAISAANGRTVALTVEEPQKFRRRWKVANGEYASVLEGTADEADDRPELLAYAERIKATKEAADVDCTFELPGIHTEYAIGDLITEIEGRSINLDAAPAISPNRRYPQIVRRQFVYSPSPKTILTVDRGVSPREGETSFAKQNRRPPTEVV